MSTYEVELTSLITGEITTFFVVGKSIKNVRKKIEALGLEVLYDTIITPKDINGSVYEEIL